MSNQNNKRRPFKWYTDGDKVIKVFEGDSIPVSFYPGRKKKQSSESLQQTTISEQQSQSNINKTSINIESLENESVSQITYYIQYILIVTLIMANFSTIISVIKESIANLTGFINCLVPILLALMSATRKCCIY